MADIIRVSTEELNTAASKYGNCKLRFQNAYLQMSNAVRVVDTSWNGDASEAFKAKFDQMYKNIELTEQKVKDAEDELKKAAELYGVTELNLSGTIDDLEVGTSPFDS